jgi:MFS family permease
MNKLSFPPRELPVNPTMKKHGFLLFLSSAHFVLVSNVLYLVVFDRGILPDALLTGINRPLLKAAHAFTYAVFLFFCSQNTNPKNQYSRALTGMYIGAASTLALVILSMLPFSIFHSPGPLKEVILVLYFTALICGGYGDAVATPALLGIIASADDKNGPKYVGYFYSSVSISCIYIPLLATWVQPFIRLNPDYRSIPFIFDLLLSILALILFPYAYKCMEKSPAVFPGNAAIEKLKPSIRLPDLWAAMKSHQLVLACVLILAANQFAYNSLKTASQELAAPWKYLGFAGNAVLFCTASYLVTRKWNKNKITGQNTRPLVLISLGIILIVGLSVIILKRLPGLGAGMMLLFGPFSAILYTGINIYYAQYALTLGPGNIGACLGIFSALYRFFGSIGYLVTGLIVILMDMFDSPQEKLPVFAFIVNGLPMIIIMVYFAAVSKNKKHKKIYRRTSCIVNLTLMKKSTK